MTLIPPHKIAVVMETQFGESLIDLVTNMYTWIVDSTDNRKSLKVIPESDWHDPDNGVTFFKVDTKKFVEQQFIETMSSIDENYGPFSVVATWSVLEVYGVTPTFLISEVLKSEYGVIHIEATPQGFIASRANV